MAVAKAGSKPRVESRFLVERVMQILVIVQSERAPNCPRLAEILEVSRRTVLRDIEYMRDRLGIDIEFNDAAGGYKLRKPIHSFPAMQVRRVDLLALLVARVVLAEFGSIGLDQDLRRLFEHLSQHESEWVTAEWSSLQKLFSVKVSGTTPVDPKIFRLLGDSIENRTEITLTYRKAEAEEASMRTVRPYHLTCVNAQWYLMTFDLKHNELRTFAVTPSRMLKVQTTKKKFEIPPDFSAAKLLAGGFGVRHKKHATEKIVLRFDAELATVIKERKWHASQEIKQLKSGDLQLTMHVYPSKELINWIMSWGPLVQVQEPAGLRRQVVDLLRNALSRYEGGVAG